MNDISAVNANAEVETGRDVIDSRIQVTIAWIAIVCHS